MTKMISLLVPQWLHLLLLLAWTTTTAQAFVPLARHFSPVLSSSALFATKSTKSTTTTSFLKSTITNQIRPTQRGRSTTSQQRYDIQQSLQLLETTCDCQEPARSPLVEGLWVVDYTTAPPPSNGVLGPWQGIAKQQVQLDSSHKYCNQLSVGKDWLTAELIARWDEWDGVFLVENTKKDNKQWKGDGFQDNLPNTIQTKIPQNNWFESLFAVGKIKPTKNTQPDFGATCWVVTFETLELKLFGQSIMKQTFQNVQRVWRTTYVDAETRIVRAGRTGRQEDEMVFYMTREKLE